MIKSSQSGFTLIEILVALIIFIVGFLGIHKSVFSVLKNDIQLKNEKIAHEVVNNYIESLTYNSTQGMNIDEIFQIHVPYNGKTIILDVKRINSKFSNTNKVEIHASINEMSRGVSIDCEYSVSKINNKG